ncbi:MAG: DUF1461 domain-containing protein [Anaerosomatales bacterium]|nr:DUF1461 domain-containing protein [Anaerosomatales bacterium]MDT8433759.1 DUF1461 domain-containing protein [Anaerosomatales bacterium]
MTTGWRLASLVAGFGLALAVIGLPLRLMLLPAYTRTLVVWVDAPARADLDVEQARALAEGVRAFVADEPGATLPASLADGRPAFDESATSHLDDVRVVLAAARTVTLLVTGAAIVWVVVVLQLRRRRELALSLHAGALFVVALAALAAVIALADFDRFFAGFHALFFEKGTWQFPADALLIRLFPEPFWVASGGIWGALSLAGAALLALCGRRTRPHPEGERE